VKYLPISYVEIKDSLTAGELNRMGRLDGREAIVDDGVPVN
jgi:hypothetical protein